MRQAPQVATAGSSTCTPLRLGLDVGAPGVARAAVSDRLRHVVTTAVLDDAQLVVSELVTNGICYGGGSADDTLALRVDLSAGALRLEVEDPGRGGAVVRRPPDSDGGGGLGLNIVHSISERWGVERIPGGGTRVWAQLGLRPGT
jgi:anti-sigma regulatory factor (Ser/Thr protein kinase)